MLIHQERVSIRIDTDLSAGPGSIFVSLGNKVDSADLKSELDFPSIVKFFQPSYCTGIPVPAGTKCQRVLFQQALT